MFISYKLKSSYKELHKGYQEIEDKYSQIVNLLLDATEDISQVELILTDKCFNRKEVIDLIFESDFQLVLNNEKVGRVVTDFWKGPYKTEFFMNNCYAYSQIRELFIDSNKFLGYKPASKYAFSIDRLWRQKSQKTIFEEIEQSKDKARHANSFHFEQWDKSLSTKYFIEAIFIIIGSFAMFYLVTHTLSLSLEAREIIVKASILISQLESGVLSDLEKLSIATELAPIVEEAENKIETIVSSIDNIILVNWILATYLLKLINQYIINLWVVNLKILQRVPKADDLFPEIEAKQFVKPNKTLWDNKNLTKTLEKQDNDDLMELKAKILKSYSPKEILEQFNILKKVINKCSISNMRKERKSFYPNKENLSNESWGSIGDEAHPSSKLKRSKTQKERLIKTHFQTIFYIPEFLEITFDLQSKKVFHDMIYANAYDSPSIFRFTKAGRHRFNQLQKNSLKINLELLREQYHTKVPSLQDLKLLEVTRNYECLVRFSKNNG